MTEENPTTGQLDASASKEEKNGDTRSAKTTDRDLSSSQTSANEHQTNSEEPDETRSPVTTERDTTASYPKLEAEAEENSDNSSKE